MLVALGFGFEAIDGPGGWEEVLRPGLGLCGTCVISLVGIGGVLGLPTDDAALGTVGKGARRCAHGPFAFDFG